MRMLAVQQTLRPAPPNAYGPIDYRNFRAILIKIDDILVKTNLEHRMLSNHLSAQHEKNNQSTNKSLSHSYKKLKHAVRCNIARHLTGESYRAFSLRLADSELFQWFTGTDEFGRGCGISKSSLERYEKEFDLSFVKEMTQTILNDLSKAEKSAEIGLKESIDLEKVWMDTTCVKANIHFPVDWVLLRDAARSLLCTIKTIRRQGLKHRMPSAESLLKKMNKYSIEMTHTRRKKESKKHRKRILRSMKKLTECIRRHARRYSELLEAKWTDTEWSECQKNQVISRLQCILEQIPEAIKQAHDRIIGERQTKSQEKILSLYDQEVDIIVRGKAGSEVEFGQRLLLVEQQDGLLVDWNLFSKGGPTDGACVKSTVEQLEKVYGKVSSVTADRGFSNDKNIKFLESNNVVNGLCPKSPKKLKERLEDRTFVDLQTRRSQTEGRIGIFKNVFLGKPLRSRVIENKRHAVNWCVLSHNLWVLARKVISDEESSELKQAA